MQSLYKIVVFVPEAHADTVRKAIAEAGGGRMGNYSECSFSIKGTGRFRPEPGARPAIGEIGRLESVAEERIEATVPAAVLEKVLEAITGAHPYEEPVVDIYALENK